MVGKKSKKRELSREEMAEIQRLLYEERIRRVRRFKQTIKVKMARDQALNGAAKSRRRPRPKSGR